MFFNLVFFQQQQMRRRKERVTADQIPQRLGGHVFEQRRLFDESVEFGSVDSVHELATNLQRLC